ncbi:MAG: ABC transporter permease, partial [Boseongicola sp.]|nr:ABC transporter permease [Boseongicola sp.]
MTPLHTKLMRDLWRIKAQALAIIVVIAIGVALQIMMSGFVASLTETRDAYYERHRLANIFAPVVRAPAHVLNRLSEIPGVRTVETRVTSPGTIDLESRRPPISAQFLSLPQRDRRHLNEVRMTGGRFPDAARPDEVLLLESFASAHSISPGDSIKVTLAGSRKLFKVVGTAQSPEFIYYAAPGELIPDDARFGVIWINRSTLAAALDLEGAFNEALFTLLRGVNKAAIIDRIDQVLEPYGTVGAYGLEDFPSNRFLSEEISGLTVTARTVPPLFMLVAAFLLYIVTSRLIRSEREEIGLVKAFGYSDPEVGIHYLQLALFIAITGAAMGCLLGVLLGRAMIPVYTTYYKLPFLIFRVEFASFASGILISIAVSCLGGLLALRGIFQLTPAEAMRPPTPPDFSKTISLSGPPFNRLDQSARMVLRRVMRQPWRMLGAVVGIAAGMALSLSMLIIYQGFDEAIEQSFNVIDRSDATLTFVSNAPRRTVHNLERMPGISRVEPVRFVPVVFRNGLRTYKGTITGLAPNPELFRALDKRLNAIPMPTEGIVLSAPLAASLSAKVGDEVSLEIREGRKVTTTSRIAGIADSLLGSPAYMDIDALGRAVGDVGRISGAYVSITDGWHSN